MRSTATKLGIWIGIWCRHAIVIRFRHSSVIGHGELLGAIFDGFPYSLSQVESRDLPRTFWWDKKEAGRSRYGNGIRRFGEVFAPKDAQELASNIGVPLISRSLRQLTNDIIRR